MDVFFSSLYIFLNIRFYPVTTLQETVWSSAIWKSPLTLSSFLDLWVTRCTMTFKNAVHFAPPPSVPMV